jgi:trimethylamine--corrinoid protein Co-methyltransferase
VSEEHTFDNFKKEFWLPRDINREIFRQWAKKGKTTYAQRLNARAKQILKDSQPSLLPDEKLRQLQALVDRAEAAKAH